MQQFYKTKVTVFVIKIVVLDCIIYVLLKKCIMSSVIKTIPADHSCLIRYSSTLYYQIPSILNENKIIFSCEVTA
jgi:hypothetical protein